MRYLQIMSTTQLKFVVFVLELLYLIKVKRFCSQQHKTSIGLQSDVLSCWAWSLDAFQWLHKCGWKKPCMRLFQFEIYTS